MRSSLIKINLLIFLFVFTCQFIFAQQEKNGSKPSAHTLEYATAYRAEAIEANGEKMANFNFAVQNDKVSDDVLKMYPHAIKYEKRFYPAGKNNFKIKTVKVIDQAKLNAALAAAVNEQQVEIQRLRKEVSSLKAR